MSPLDAFDPIYIFPVVSDFARPADAGERADPAQPFKALPTPLRQDGIGAVVQGRPSRLPESTVSTAY